MILNKNVVCQNQNDNYIQVSNHGVYVAYFSLIYNVNQSPSCVNKGPVYIETSQIWLMQKDKIVIPNNACNIHLNIYYAIYFSTWFLICQKYFACPTKKCYNLYGTVSNPSCIETPCNCCCNCCR